ncbi:MAG: M20/M25/M40 family metallo-hydrolase [bacterium]
MKKVFSVLGLFLFFLTIKAQINTNSQITPMELKEHIEVLASDSLLGRKPGFDGDIKAAMYIKKQLDALQIKPLFSNGLQNFEIVTSLSAGDNEFSFLDIKAELDKDFRPVSFSSNGEVTYETVFVGYGFNINEDSLKWNDYSGINVTGKTVIILRGAPAYDSINKFGNYSSLIKKAYTAKDKGAAAIIFVNGQLFDKDDNLVPLSYEQGQNSIGIPVVNISRKTADELLKPMDITVNIIEQNLNDSKNANSFEINTPVYIKTEVLKNKTSTQNVVYLLKGNDPVLSDEYVVLGAHYDHLGFGGKNSGSRVPDTSAIHYGADDNASGTSAIIEIIEKLAANKDNLKRSIIFTAFSAEEMGLLGSKYFVNNPPVDLKKIKFMVNLDMVGRLNEQTKGLSLGGTGTAVGLTELLTELTKSTELNIKFSPEGYGPSDHASFYSKDIPVLFFFTGIHDDYHTPRDVAGKINFEGEKKVCDLAYNIILAISQKQKSMVFAESGPKEQPETKRNFKVTLGIMPDVSSGDVKGLRADAVIEGRPAFKAGMHKGDIIIAMDGKPVNDIYEYMNRLQEFKVGQRITVEVLRGTEKVLLIVEL